MEKESKREQKRNSAKKAREHKTFTQKHVRLQEKKFNGEFSGLARPPVLRGTHGS
jgi:hypothetical protein